MVCSAEKPIATSVVETVEAINACNEAGVQLMTALQRRFDPNFLRVKQAIKSGEIGEVVTVKLCSRDPAPPPVEYVKGGGGIFKDMAVHDLDMARYLMDSEPVAIMALGSCQIDPAIKTLEGPEAYDTATIVMKFANGKDAIIDVCRQAPYGYDQRAEVLGKKAMVQTDNSYPNTARLYSASFTGNADKPYDFFMSRYKEAYVQETLAFVDALVNAEAGAVHGRGRAGRARDGHRRGHLRRGGALGRAQGARARPVRGRARGRGARVRRVRGGDRRRRERRAALRRHHQPQDGADQAGPEHRGLRLREAREQSLGAALAPRPQEEARDGDRAGGQGQQVSAAAAPAAQRDREALGRGARARFQNYWPAQGDRFMAPVWYTFVCVAFVSRKLEKKFHCRSVVCACSAGTVGSFSNKPLSPKVLTKSLYISVSSPPDLSTTPYR